MTIHWACTDYQFSKATPLHFQEGRGAYSKEHARDELFDAKLENLMGELNNIEKLFVEVRKDENELLDVLTKVHGDLRKLDKMLDQDMDDMDALHSSQDHKSEKVHSDPSSSQHNPVRLTWVWFISSCRFTNCPKSDFEIMKKKWIVKKKFECCRKKILQYDKYNLWRRW